MAITTRFDSLFLASRAAVAAHLFALIAAILLLVWLLHFGGGININSDDKQHVFNVHPFLMFLGFILFSGQAIMAYKTVWAERGVKKFAHGMLHLIALTMGIVGIYAAFKYHNQIEEPHMHSLHSWLGMGTICLYGLQWLFGLASFGLPGTARSTRARVLPLHVFAGLFLFLLAICTAQTGFVEDSALSQMNLSESRLVNFTGLFVLLYGLSVALTALLST